MRGVGRLGRAPRVRMPRARMQWAKTHEERCDDKVTADHSHVSADSPSPASPDFIDCRAMPRTLYQLAHEVVTYL